MKILMCKYDVDDVLIEHILHAGHQIHLVLDDFDASRTLSSEILEKVEQTYRVSTFDSIEGATAVSGQLITAGVSIDRILSFTEFSQIWASMLATLLGVPYYSVQEAARARDKRLMKHYMQSIGVKTADFISVTSADASDIERLVADLGFPVVVKPAAGMGTMNTFSATDPQSLQASLNKFSLRPEFNSTDLIVEKRIAGRELIVDAVWQNGVPVLFSVSEYFKPRLEAMEEDTELNGSFVLPARRHRTIYDRLLAFHQKLNGPFGVNSGVTHLEVFLTTADEIIFSEVATRFGGAGTTDNIAAAYGVNLKALWFDAITSDRPIREITRASDDYVGFINLQPSEAGVITLIPEEAEVRSISGVEGFRELRHVGETYSADHPSEWCVFVLAKSSSQSGLRDTLEEVSRTHKVLVASQADLVPGGA